MQSHFASAKLEVFDEINNQGEMMSGWITWGGGEMPVGVQTKVDVHFRGGQTPSTQAAGFWDWGHHDWPSDIVAYSVVAGQTDGWITWNGGECPVDSETMVELKFLTGDPNAVVKAGDWLGRGNLYVVAYRVVADADGWLRRNVGERPIVAPRGTRVELKFRDGSIKDDATYRDGNDTDIIAYRVVAEQWGRTQAGRNEVFSDGLTEHDLAEWQKLRDLANYGKATPPASAPDLLSKAGSHMQDRAATYDKPEGERSMATTVAMFNLATGRDLRESEGWLLLDLLKIVRSEQRATPHQDSIEDHVAYAALYGEAKLKEGV